jgi:hypothetical protein
MVFSYRQKVKTDCKTRICIADGDGGRGLESRDRKEGTLWEGLVVE